MNCSEDEEDCELDIDKDCELDIDKDCTLEVDKDGDVVGLCSNGGELGKSEAVGSDDDGDDDDVSTTPDTCEPSEDVCDVASIDGAERDGGNDDEVNGLCAPASASLSQLAGSLQLKALYD